MLPAIVFCSCASIIGLSGGRPVLHRKLCVMGTHVPRYVVTCGRFKVDVFNQRVSTRVVENTKISTNVRAIVASKDVSSDAISGLQVVDRQRISSGQYRGCKVGHQHAVLEGTS